MKQKILEQMLNLNLLCYKISYINILLALWIVEKYEKSKNEFRMIEKDLL